MRYAGRRLTKSFHLFVSHSFTVSLLSSYFLKHSECLLGVRHSSCTSSPMNMAVIRSTVGFMQPYIRPSRLSLLATLHGAHDTKYGTHTCFDFWRKMTADTRLVAYEQPRLRPSPVPTGTQPLRTQHVGSARQIQQSHYHPVLVCKLALSLRFKQSSCGQFSSAYPASCATLLAPLLGTSDEDTQ